MKSDKLSFNNRAFVSVGTLLFFIGLVISGIGIQTTGHEAISFVKVYWIVIHNFMAITFIVFSISHIRRNCNEGKTKTSQISL